MEFMLRLFNEKDFKSKEEKERKKNKTKYRKHKNHDICGKY